MHAQARTHSAPIYLNTADEAWQNAFCTLGDCRCDCVQSAMGCSQKPNVSKVTSAHS